MRSPTRSPKRSPEILTYAKIAAGSPSQMAAMTDHLLSQTLPAEVAELGRSYTGAMELAELRHDMHPLVAAGLGIDPTRPLDRDQLNALLGGNRADGERIEGKHYREAFIYTDPYTGETKEKVPIGSVDFCLTPDKSVSLAWAFGVPAERAAIYRAHREAGAETLRYLESQIAFAKLGDGGKDGTEPGHVGWIAFDHYTSRPTLALKHGDATRIVTVPGVGDPNLHTHFVVPSAVFCESGRVGSLDLDRLKGLIKEGGALYQAHLATKLRELGAHVVLDEKTGMARLPAIPEPVRDHFSKKTRNGEEAAREYAKAQGLDWDTLSEGRRVGLLKAGTQGLPDGLDDLTRRKLSRDDMADFASWRGQADELGWKHATIESYGPPAPAISREERLWHAYDTALPWLEKEIGQRAVVSGPDVRTAALRGLIAAGIDDTRDVSVITAIMRKEGVRQNGEKTSLAWGEDRRGRVRVTTGLHLAQEQEFVRLAQAASGDRAGALTGEQIDRAIAGLGESYSGEQRAAIHRLGEGGRFGVVLGSAGAGKTTSLRPLVRAWEEQGRDVHGIALAWRQADDLAGAGIAQKNLKAISVFLQAAKAGELTLGERSVVIVDEISLLGARQGLELLRLQEGHGFRLAMLGDEKQAQSIEASSIIELTRKALGDEQIPTILTTVRQQTAREREIADLFREGRADDTRQALAMKQEDGTVELVPGSYQDTVARAAALVRERLETNREPEYTLTVSAPTNADAQRLAVAIRGVKREMGLIGEDRIVLKAADDAGNGYDLPLAVGDRIRLFRSTRAEGEGGSIGRNGSVLEMMGADARGAEVRNERGRVARIAWASMTDGQGRVQLAYGEVRTTHAAQGSTSTEHLYVLPGGSQAVTGFSAYSSGTRHRQRSYLLLSEGAERANVRQQRALGDMRPITREQVWDQVAANFSRQPKKDLASDLVRKTGELRHGTIGGLLGALRPGEVRQRRAEIAGQPVPATTYNLYQAFLRQQQAQTLRPAMQRIQPQLERQQTVMQDVMDRTRELARAVRHRVERIRETIGRERGLHVQQ